MPSGSTRGIMLKQKEDGGVGVIATFDILDSRY